MASSARSTAPGRRRESTCRLGGRDTWAMPPPIWPAPTTSTVWNLGGTARETTADATAGTLTILRALPGQRRAPYDAPEARAGAP